MAHGHEQGKVDVKRDLIPNAIRDGILNLRRIPFQQAQGRVLLKLAGLFDIAFIVSRRGLADAESFSLSN